MGLSLQEVINNFIASEEREADLSTQSIKRDNSQMSGRDLVSPPNKKNKKSVLKKSISASTSSLIKKKQTLVIILVNHKNHTIYQHQLRQINQVIQVE